MEKIPLIVRLKKEAHRKIASAQDLVVKEVYQHFSRAVLHGGTAIWRCYQGKRFSEDLDFYLERNIEKIKELFDSFEKKGYIVKKKKISDRSIYSELELGRISIRFEATFQKVKGIIADYETSDGNFITIYSLSPESFIIEKISTYLKRRKIRDLWDIFFLLRTAKNYKLFKNEAEKLIKNYSPPLDEEDLKAIILEGIISSSNEMISYIKRKWENEYI